MNIAILVLCVAAVVATGAAAAPEEALTKDLVATPAAPKTLDVSQRVVDGVLSMLGVEGPGAALAELDDEGQTKEAGPGERGIHKIHKKKFIKYHLWHAFTWWAWVVAVVVIKFKVALLLIWGHLSYFIMALVRMLLREVPLWVQLKRDNAPVYGQPAYGQPAYGPQYGSHYAASSYSPYKRRAGSAGTATTGAAEAVPAAGGDLAYGAHARK